MKNQNITFTLAILFMNCFGVFAPKTFGVTPTPDGCIQGSPRRKDVARFKISPAELQIRELAGLRYSGLAPAASTLPLAREPWSLTTKIPIQQWDRTLLFNTAGTGNSALGTAALVNNDSGSNHTAVGDMALQNNTSDFNTALGAGAGAATGIVSNNIYIDDGGLDGDTNIIAIGNIPASGTSYDAMYVGGVVGAGIATADAVPVYIDQTTGQLGTVLTDGSVKKATRGTRRGTQHQSMLDQFQKQQKRIAELESMVARLAATVKKQAAQIEKVSAELELRKPAQQVVANKE